MSEGTNKYNSTGGNTGSPLEHCVDNVNEIPFPKHFPNKPGIQANIIYLREYMELADAGW